MSEDWDWKLTDRSKRQFEALDEYARDRIISKLEEVVTDQWREPTDYLEPLAGAPHQKLRVDSSASDAVPIVNNEYWLC